MSYVGDSCLKEPPDHECGSARDRARGAAAPAPEKRTRRAAGRLFGLAAVLPLAGGLAYGAAGFLRSHSENLLGGVRRDMEQLGDWQALVSKGQIDFDNRYRSEYLTSEKFHGFDDALLAHALVEAAYRSCASGQPEPLAPLLT